MALGNANSAASAGTVELEVSHDPHELLALGPELDELVASVPDASVFQTSAWSASWWQTYAKGPRWTGNRSALHLVTIRRGGRLVACHPLLAASLGGGPASLRLLVGIGEENADLGGPVVSASDGEAVDLLVGHLTSLVDEGRTVVSLGRRRPGDELLDQFQRALDPGRYLLHAGLGEEYPFVRFDHLKGARPGEAPDDAMDRLERRTDVTRRLRRLAEVGDIAWTDRHPDPAGAGLAEFVRLHDLRWAGRDANGPFTTIAGQRFLAQTFRCLEPTGAIRLSFLECDGRPIAGRVGIVDHGRYLGMKSAWDPEWSRFGPGHLMTARVLRLCMAEGLDEVDLLRGRTEHKMAWATRSRLVRPWTLSASGTAGRVDLGVLRVLRKLRHQWRERPRPEADL